MVAYNRQRLILPIAVASGAMIALFAALAVAILPVWRVEALVMTSGLPSILPAAEPPPGQTARFLLCFLTAIGAGVVGGTLVFALLRATVRPRPLSGDYPAEVVPQVRRADAHPDAPPRPPVLATRELGAPLMSIAPELDRAPVERDLPRDLDTPMADYDPTAFAESHPPAPIVRDVPTGQGAALPRPAIFDDGERFETFALAPPAPEPFIRGTATRATAPVDREASVHALLERLEAGVARRAGGGQIAAADTRLTVALDSLRRLAAQAG